MTDFKPHDAGAAPDAGGGDPAGRRRPRRAGGVMSEPDWDTIMEQEIESRDQEFHGDPPCWMPDPSGLHCLHWHDGGHCCACGQLGPDSQAEAPY